MYPWAASCKVQACLRILHGRALRDGGNVPNPMSEKKLLRETEALLDVFKSNDGSAWKPALESLRALLSAEHSAVFSLSAGLSGIHVDFVHAQGFVLSDARMAAKLQGWCDSHGGTWVGFDPLSRDAFQANRAVTSSDLRRHIPGYAETARTLHSRFALDHKDQLRVLVYSGDHFLGWVGAFREEPFCTHQTALLRRLMPAISRRLTWEHRMMEASNRDAALETLMEVLAGPAFVVGKGPRVVYANAAGRALIARDYRNTCKQISTAIKGEASDLQTLRISDGSSEWLVFSPLRDTDAIAARAKRKWRLTHRQGEIAARVLRGFTNKQVAADLYIAENTVEYHLTRIFHSSGTTTRSEFSARAYKLL
jgi:DNA-binding CsgD family transcriptional regulator